MEVSYRNCEEFATVEKDLFKVARNVEDKVADVEIVPFLFHQESSEKACFKRSLEEETDEKRNCNPIKDLSMKDTENKDEFRQAEDTFVKAVNERCGQSC